MKNVEFLKQNGFDIDAAMGYLGDMETFDEILKDFYDGLFILVLHIYTIVCLYLINI